MSSTSKSFLNRRIVKLEEICSGKSENSTSKPVILFSDLALIAPLPKRLEIVSAETSLKRLRLAMKSDCIRRLRIYIYIYIYIYMYVCIKT